MGEAASSPLSSDAGTRGEEISSENFQAEAGLGNVSALAKAAGTPLFPKQNGEDTVSPEDFSV